MPGDALWNFLCYPDCMLLPGVGVGGGGVGGGRGIQQPKEKPEYATGQ